jgi:hypothetical protein
MAADKRTLLIDITGRRFGRLVVVRRDGSDIACIGRYRRAKNGRRSKERL